MFDKTCSGRVTPDMQAPIKRRKKRGKLYFSSTKALKTSRMGRTKVATQSYETSGVNKVLDFEDTEENTTLVPIEESQGHSNFKAQRPHSREASKDMETPSNPASTPASQEQSEEEEFEETSLMEPEGGFQDLGHPRGMPLTAPLFSRFFSVIVLRIWQQVRTIGFSVGRCRGLPEGCR